MAKVFVKMVWRIELARLSPQCRTACWTFLRRLSDLFVEGKHSEWVDRLKGVKVRVSKLDGWLID